MNRVGFRVALFRVSNQLLDQQLEFLKFMSRSVLINSQIDKIRSSLDLFNALEERGKLSAENTAFLHRMLESTGCFDLRRELIEFPPTGPIEIDQNFLFYECLLKVAMGLESGEFDTVKYFFKDQLQQNVQRIYTATELFQLLIQRQIIRTTDLKQLYYVLIEVGRVDLGHEVNQYMLQVQRQPYQQLTEYTVPRTLNNGGQQQFAQPMELETPLNESNSCGNQINPHSGLFPVSTPWRAGFGMSSLNSMEEPDFTHLSDPGKSEHFNSQVGGQHPESQQSTFNSMEEPDFTPLSDPGKSEHLNSQVGDQHPEESQKSSKDYGGQHPEIPSYPVHPPPSTQQQSQNQQLQSELARKGSALQLKEDNIMQYQTQLMGMQARINSVADQHQGKEREYEQRISELETLLKRMTNEGKLQRGMEYQTQLLGILSKEIEYQQKIFELESILEQITGETELQKKEIQNVYEQLQVASHHLPQDNDYYKMSRSPHGVCLIINNYEFHHSDPDKQYPRRNGADVDVHNLTQTFKYLRYKVEVKENLSSTQMQEELLRMANQSHAQYDSFICCILTEGEQGVVYGSDCEAVNFNDLAGVMKMCPSLYGKPKLFFIQSCRGDQETKGFELPERDTSLDGPKDRKTKKFELPERYTTWDVSYIQASLGDEETGQVVPELGRQYQNTIPQEADFYFGFATHTGNSAYRSRRYGSWFISEVCKVFIKHSYTHDLRAMMVKVNKRVSDAYTKDGYKQAPESVNRLRFQVHFFRFIKGIGH